MSAAEKNIRIVKKDSPHQSKSANIPADEVAAPMLAYLEGEWHETLMKLARLAKLLKRKRRCENCGHAL